MHCVARSETLLPAGRAGEGSRFFQAYFLIFKTCAHAGQADMGQRAKATSREYLIDDVTMNIGQSSIGTIESVSKFRMVDTHQMQDGRMEVVTPDWFK